MLTTESTFQDIQRHLGPMYDESNDRMITNADMITLMGRGASYLLKAVRRGNHERIRGGLADTVGWAATISNRLHINLGDLLRNYFPGVCPYCGVCPCNPVLHSADGRKNLSWLQGKISIQSVREDQLMMARIYPNNTLQDSAEHVVEEVSEVAVAHYVFGGKHEPGQFSHIRLEMADVLANLCGVATCHNLSLIQVIVDAYGNGCPGCNRLEKCSCRFSRIAGV